MGEPGTEEQGMSEVRCEPCGSTMVEITLKVGEGTVVMRSCSRCDRRSWLSDGEPVELPGVLDQIGTTRR
jgi:hypothetical protein